MMLGCNEKLVQKHIPNPVALRTLKKNSPDYYSVCTTPPAYGLWISCPTNIKQ